MSHSSGDSPFNNNAPWLGNQPASSYHAFMYYPGELYNYNCVVGGPQPGASLTMTTTGINQTAVAGNTYTATIQYGNVSWTNCNANPSANIAFNILANGVVVSSEPPHGAGSKLRRGLRSRWAGSRTQRTPAKPFNSSSWRRTSSKDQPPHNSGRCPALALANTTLTAAAPPANVPTAPSGLTATAVSSSQINLSWTDNSNNETGFKIDQATEFRLHSEPDHGHGWRQRDHLQRHGSVVRHHVLLPRPGHQRQRLIPPIRPRPAPRRKPRFRPLPAV